MHTVSIKQVFNQVWNDFTLLILVIARILSHQLLVPKGLNIYLLELFVVRMVLNTGRNFKYVSLRITKYLCFYVLALFMTPVFIVYCVMFLHDSYWCCDGAPAEIVRRQLDYAFVVGCCVAPFYVVSLCIIWCESRRLGRIEDMERYKEQVRRQRVPGLDRNEAVRNANKQDGFYHEKEQMVHSDFE